MPYKINPTTGNLDYYERGSAPVEAHWQIVNTTGELEANNSYFTSNASSIMLALPATATLGDKIEVVRAADGNWRITQSAGQQIFMGDKITALGTSGYIESTVKGDWITLVYYDSNVWFAKSEQGNLYVQEV